MEWLYDRNGQAKLFTYEDRLISKNGKNLAWIYNENIYNIENGKHIGWFENGVLYDKDNKALAFTIDCTGCIPYRPGIGGRPGTPGIPGCPGRLAFSGIPGRAGYSGWSNNCIENYFEE